MEKTNQINNTFYDHYGDRWYHAYDDPVALLRAENEIKFPWILEKINSLSHPCAKILDVGCGGGFLSNELAKNGYFVTGIDLSSQSLNVAKKYDVTRSVHYEVADAFHLPYADNSFDVITAMDFLEHIEDPELVIMEFSRVLKNGGIFFFHTFNRNPISHLFAIKFVEWFIKNTPKDMHMIKYFIKPKELEIYCSRSGLKVMSMIGIRPLLKSIDWEMIKTGIVSKKMKFTLTTSKIISYMGLAVKRGE